MQRRKMKIRIGKLFLVLMSFAVGGATFVCLDYFYSRAILRMDHERRLPSAWTTACNVPDPVRHHAFRPNCAETLRWGKDSYQQFTNSLGFRDDRIRQVPLADPRPRLLFLGDSMTQGMVAWSDSYAGKIAARLPQYEILNGGIWGYSPSNYLNVARMVLAAGVEFDEAVVFIDISDVQDEAAYYQDVDASGAVTGPDRERWVHTWYADFRPRISRYLLLTNRIFEFVEQEMVRHGYYHLTVSQFGNTFDLERSAWTYRRVSDRYPYLTGYAPLGVEGGIAKEKTKMALLWQELAKRNIPISVVVSPWPAQVVHDTADSPQVRIWRDWCAGKCKRFISLFPFFLAVRDQCPASEPGCWYRSYFIFGDVHYTAAGNAVVADAVIKSLEAMPAAKLPPTKGKTAASRTSTTLLRSNVKKKSHITLS